MQRGKGTFVLAGGALLCAVALAQPARADLVLNAAGVADGFSVTNFATGLPSSGPSFGFGPFGLAVTNNGSGGSNVIVSDYANSTGYVFNNSDGQTPGTALSTFFSNSGTQGYATLNGVAYGTQSGHFGSFSSTGTFTPLSIAGLPGPYLGMAGDNQTGEIIATSGAGLIAINPTTNSYRVINSGGNGDGVSVSPDGKTAYVEQGGHIVGYDVQTGAVVFNVVVPNGPDGTGVIASGNSLNGDIIVNTNSGDVYLIDPVANTVTLIGSNNSSGQRGDYTAPDYTTGTLLLDYSTEIERLSCGAGCGIGSGPPPVPEPSTLALLGTALLGLFAAFRRRTV
jgi:hypothetical protein